MEFQFQTDVTGQPIAKCGIESEAFGDWLGNDLGADRPQIRALLDIVEKLLAKKLLHYQLIGKEYTLDFEDEEVLITLNHHQTSHEEFAQEYDLNISAGCGLVDFQRLLQEWKHFIR